MDFVSLIANTGIQFADFKIKLNPEKFRELKFNYFEGCDSSSVPLTYWLDELIEIKSMGKFIRRMDLQDLKMSPEKLRNDDNAGVLNVGSTRLFEYEEPDTYVISNAEKTLQRFEKKWLPLPYFKNNQINESFGPTDWVRIWYEILPNKDLHIALAVDTMVSDDPNQNHTPLLSSNPNENKYTLCTNEDSIMGFFSTLNQCEWVEKWLSSYFDIKPEDSQTPHLASYFHFLRILNSGEYLPRIQILSDNADIIDLDLAIDVGNSHTCAVLFETPSNGEVNFNQVKKLSIRNLSRPTQFHTQAFSTRIVFREETFGMKDSFFPPLMKFQWSSVVRMGFEAEDLIQSQKLSKNVEYENKSFYSSPKRYLWDDLRTNQPWNYHSADSEILKNVELKGITDQFKSDGTLCTDGAFAQNPTYPRKTLMTFLFLEIFSQAVAQFNSFEFRTIHGKPNARRRLRHVIISCPTAMIKEEQYALRKSADDAAQVLKNFHSRNRSEMFDYKSFISEGFNIIPQLRDIRKNRDELEDKVDWTYDEATAPQLVFLYGLIQKKFDGNSSDLYRIFGHKSKDNRQLLTIGSLDIGGGTSDLMICEYELNFQNSTELIPNPLYFESFHKAGDDLIKNIVQNIIIEGREASTDDINCTGVIENYGYSLYGPSIYDKINGFFGKDAAAMSYLAKMMRVNFLNQIGIPIAHKYLECANLKTSRELSYDDLFKDRKPSQDLLNFFKNHFGFSFENLKWNLNPEKVNNIIRDSFSKLILQVSKLMHAHRCDYIIISGRPCSFNIIEKLFLENHPLQPNRFINLNNYWIGRWYPFADNNGYVEDAKTIVATGTLIGFMATKYFKLNKFKINPINLIQKIGSTANYAGHIKDNVLTENYITPTINEAKFKVFDIPHFIGIRNINSSNYPARHLFQIQYSNQFLEMKMNNQKTNNKQDIINRYNAKMPYEITIRRDSDVDLEKFYIEDIIDKDGELCTQSMFVLRLMTLENENGYWFDTAEFALTIKSREA